MKSVAAVISLTGVMAFCVVAAIAAHEVTYNGTVAAVKPNRYSASDGVLATVELSVSDRRRPMVFDVTQNTRVWRGDNMVSFAAARIEKGESAAVTINHEEPEAGALEIRLEAQ